MSEKTNNAITIVLLISIVVLVIININLGSRLTNLEMSLNRFQSNQIQEMQSLRWELLQEINSINEQIVQSTKLSFDESVLIQGYNKPDSSVNVEISFYLREYSIEDNVNVTAVGLNGQTFSAEANLSESGRFTAAMTLPAQDNYILSFTTNRGLSIKTEELTTLPLADKLCNRFRYTLGNGRQFFNTNSITYTLNPHFANVTLNPHLVNNTSGNQALTLKKISLSVEADGIVIGTWDLLPYLQNRGNMQTIDADDIRGHIEIPVVLRSRNDEENARSRDLGYIISDELFVARLVIYDYLGIRYEQADQIYVSSSPNRGGGSGGSSGIGSAGSPPNRFIEYGEYAWGFIHIVRQ